VADLERLVAMERIEREFEERFRSLYTPGCDEQHYLWQKRAYVAMKLRKLVEESKVNV
jgi:hypothetical protein